MELRSRGVLGTDHASGVLLRTQTTTHTVAAHEQCFDLKHRELSQSLSHHSVGTSVETTNDSSPLTLRGAASTA